jgi:hypothetical protein
MRRSDPYRAPVVAPVLASVDGTARTTVTALPESQLTADLRTPYCHSPAAARPTNPTKITNLHRRRIQALRHEGGLHDRSQRHTRHTCHISPASHPTRRDRLSDPLRGHQLAPVLAAVEPNPPTSTDQPPDTLRFQASAQDAVKVAFTTSRTHRTHRRNLSSHNTSTRPTWPTVRSTSRWVSTPGTNHSYQGSPDTNRLGSRSLTRSRAHQVPHGRRHPVLASGQTNQPPAGAIATSPADAQTRGIGSLLTGRTSRSSSDWPIRVLGG